MIQRLARAATDVRTAGFIINFGLAKALVYFLPLLVAGIASARLYGSLELGLAIGLQTVALVLGAPLAGITQAYLVRKEDDSDLVVLIAAATAGAILVASALLAASGAAASTLLIMSVLPAVIVQSTASSWSRMVGRRNFAAWADSASIVLTGSIVALVALTIGTGNVSAAVIALSVLNLGILVAAAVLLARTLAPGAAARLRRVSMLGMPMMISGLFGTWLAVGGRMLVGAFSPADTAAYSLAFRIAGLALGLHQLAMTAGFARIYSSRVRSGDRLISYFLAVVALACAAMAVIGPLLPGFLHFSAVSHDALPTYRRLVPVLALQTFFWIGFALLQMRINRYGLAGRSIVPFLAITLGGVAVIAAAATILKIGVVGLTWLVTLQTILYVCAAFALLARRRIPHRKAMLVSIGAGLMLAGLAAALSL